MLLIFENLASKIVSILTWFWKKGLVTAIQDLPEFFPLTCVNYQFNTQSQ